MLTVRSGTIARLAVAIAATVAIAIIAPHETSGAAATPTWHTPVEVVPTNGWINDLACSQHTCLAATTNGITTSADGTTFHHITAGPGVMNPTSAVWCSGTGAACVAVGFSGTTWTTADDGAHWVTGPSFSTTVASLEHGAINDQISCTPGVGCALILPFSQNTSYEAPVLFAPWKDGSLSAWRTATTTSGVFQDLSCSGTGTCVAVGTDPDHGLIVITSSDGGASWSPASGEALTPYLTSTIEVAAVNCVVGTNHCFVGGGVAGFPGTPFIVTTSDGGATWAAGSTNGLTGNVLSIGCQSETTCTVRTFALPLQGALGATQATTTDGGATWTSAVVAPATNLSCTTSACFAFTPPNQFTFTFQVPLNQLSRLYASTTLGTWNERLTIGTVNLGTPSCSSTATCAVLSSPNGEILSLLRSTNGASSWSAAGTVPRAVLASATTALACSTAACTVVGSTPTATGTKPVVVTTTTNGTSWTTAPLSDLAGHLNAATCSGLRCVAVGGTRAPGAPGPATATIFTSSNGGVTWSKVPLSISGDLNAVSCASKTACTAVGASNGATLVVATTTGTSWSKVTGATPGMWTAVSCPSTTSCFVAGHNNQGQAIAAPMAKTVGAAITKSGTLAWAGCTGVTCSFSTLVHGAVWLYTSTNGAKTFATAKATGVQPAAGATNRPTPATVSPPSCVSASFCIQSASTGTVSLYR
jgi:hypothetical protein